MDAGKYFVFYKQLRSRLSELWTVTTMSDSDDEAQVPVPTEARDTKKGKGKLRAICKTKIPVLSARQHAVAQAKKPAPVRALSGMTLEADFEMAEAVLQIRWDECKQSHHNKLNEAANDVNPKYPMSKSELASYLTRKMGAFAKIINNLPTVESITTDAKRQADIDDTEDLTKNLETYILRTWDNQAVLDMGF